MLNQENNHLISKKILDASLMKIFIVYAVAAMLLFGLVGCGTPRFSESRAKYMEQNIDKIKIGMTKQELKDLLGKPDNYIPKSYFFYDDEGLEKATSWLYLYPNDDFLHNVEFDHRTGRIIKFEKESAGF